MTINFRFSQKISFTLLILCTFFNFNLLLCSFSLSQTSVELVSLPQFSSISNTLGIASLQNAKTTIIDALSSNPRYRKFITYLQRLHLIMDFNKMQNVTVLAPTNSAFEEYERLHSQRTTQAETAAPNTEASANKLISPTYHGMTREKMLLSVIRDGVYGSSTWVDGMVWESNSGWRPANSNDTSPENNTIDGVMLKTRIDKFGRIMIGNVEVQDGEIWCTSGVVLPLSGVLDDPPKLVDIISNGFNETALKTKEGFISEPSNRYSHFRSALAAAGWDDIIFFDSKPKGKAETSKKFIKHTLWVPSNEDLSSNFIWPQWNYLTLVPSLNLNEKIKKTAVADVRTIIRKFVSPGSISIARLGKGSHQIPVISDDGMFSNSNITVQILSKSDARINGMHIDLADCLAYDGIAHKVNSQNANLSSEISWNPKKIMLGLNATRFVDLLIKHDLGDYIDGAMKGRWTFLVPTNKAIDRFEYFSDFFGYKDVKSWLLYHIISGKFDKSDLKDGQLLRTEYKPSSLDNNKQIVKVHLASSNASLNTNGVDKNHKRVNWVTFNGAPLETEDAVQVDDYAAIYLLAESMSPPEPLINSLVQDLNYSSFIGMLSNVPNLLRNVSNTSSLTFLVPNNDAVLGLGLVYNYLIRPGDLEAKIDLKKLVTSHICAPIIYSDLLSSNCTKFDTQGSCETSTEGKTLNGDSVWFSKGVKSNKLLIHKSPPTSPDFELEKGVSIVEQDVAFSSGVIHRLPDTFLFPQNLVVSPEKLLRGMNSLAFGFLLDKLNMSFVLDPAQNDNFDILNRENKIKDNGCTLGYSFLVPPDQVWSDFPPFREFARRSISSPNGTVQLTSNFRFLEDKFEDENPWRNKTTQEIKDLLTKIVKLHILPIRNSTESSTALPTEVGTVEYETLLDDVSINFRETAGRKVFFVNDQNLRNPNPSYPIPPIGMPPDGSNPGQRSNFGIVMRSGQVSSSHFTKKENLARSAENNYKFMVYEIDAVLLFPETVPAQNGSSWFARLSWQLFLGLTVLGLVGGFSGLACLWVISLRTLNGYEQI